MDFEQIINSGLDRAEVVSSNILIDGDMRHYSVCARDLTTNIKWNLTWELNLRENDLTDEELAYLFLRMANEDLEEFRKEPLNED